jgi:hypothetical protein
VCKVEKELSLFNNKPGGHLGKDTRCKECQGVYSKQLREQNYEKYRANEIAYKEQNREKVREAGREFYRENKESESLRKKEYRQANPKLVSAQKKVYRSKPEVKLQNLNYVKNKYKTNPQFRLKKLLYTRQNCAMRDIKIGT